MFYAIINYQFKTNELRFDSFKFLGVHITKDWLFTAIVLRKPAEGSILTEKS